MSAEPASFKFSRRGILRAGALGVAGITLADVLRLEAAAGIRSSHKAVINVHLDGGPPQMDLIDPKPDAPREQRGEFESISTNVPGIHLTELMPQMAKAADKFVFLRSLVGAAGRHDAFQCQSGFSFKDLSGIGGRPAMGCVVSQLQGQPTDAMPAFVDLMQGRPLARNSARPGFLGPAYRPFRPDLSHLFKRQLEPGMQSELARLGNNHTLQLELTEGLTVGRLEGRMSLAKDFDLLRRNVDRSGSMEALDKFSQQALGILTSGRVARALDLESEDRRVLDRFSPRMKRVDPTHYTTEGPGAARKFLLARRMVEAGARCVSISLSDFDTHRSNAERMRFLGPLMDHSLAALVSDLEERGMLDDVMIIAWGEFGRTPKVNDKGGRDHWPRVAMGIMAGGGIRGGQVIGSTDKYASEATSSPVHYQDVIATLYQHLGIDARNVTLTDTTGRPQYLVDIGAPIARLFA
ncbi:MAG: DUF1501 domain-containing protein [Verrucomicrobiia bacterium]|jgi:uncharacterized protein (DUF1501 family)